MNPATMLRDGFAGAVVVVVGGHGDVGGAVARQAAELGSRVVAMSRRCVAAAGPPADGCIAALPVDVTDPESVTSAMARLHQWFGRVDVLVNSAGSTRTVPAADLHRLTDDIVDEVFASNATGPLRLVREALPLLRSGVDPVVVQVSSVAARTGLGSNTAYGAAKAAVDAMLVSWAKALAPIRFVGVAPSALANDFVPDRGPEFLDRTIAATPMRRLATADEVAAAVLTASRVLTMTTGVTIAVDGGRHL